jgi:hypothetical protein
MAGLGPAICVLAVLMLKARQQKQVDAQKRLAFDFFSTCR